MDPVLNETSQQIQNALEHLKKELSSIRAGRANPSLLEDIPIMAYGAQMKLMEVGTISAPQPSLLTIQIWDPSIGKDVENAILNANLGLNPANDGITIRIPIPPLTSERREEFIKIAHQKGEACRVEIRRIRQMQREDMEEDKKKGDIGEDEYHRIDKQLQELIDNSMAQVENLIKEKEETLREI